MKLFLSLRLLRVCAMFLCSSSAFSTSIIGLHWSGAFMNNYNPVWGGEMGIFHTGPLNCCSYTSPYGYNLRLGIYLDRYFNILDGTVFPKPLYRRILLPISYGGYLSLQGVLERYGFVGARRRKKLRLQSPIDIRIGCAPTAYIQIVKSINKNMSAQGLIPSENPVLRGVDYGMFLGINAYAELMVALTKMLSLSLQSQLDVFLKPVPMGDFPNRDIVPNLPIQRTRAALQLNRLVLPSFLLSLNVHFLHNQRKVFFRTKQQFQLFRKKRKLFK